MNRRRIAFAVLTVALGSTVLGAVLPGNLPSYQPPQRASVSEWSQADTVEAGRVFIVQLPDTLSGLAIEAYSSDRLPLNSWLLEKIFFWATTPEDRGTHAFNFQGRPQLPEEESEVMPTEETMNWTLTMVVQ